MITRWINRLLGRRDAIYHVGTALDRVRLGDGVAAVSSAAAGVDLLKAELGRARRYEHDLSIVVLSTTPVEEDGSQVNAASGNGSSIIETHLPQVVSLITAAALREVLRESDVVHYQPSQNRFVLALAESGGEEARGALRRIQSFFRSRLRLEVRAGAARFPEDGLTLDDLIAVAAHRIAELPASVFHARTPERPAPSEIPQPALKAKAYAAGGE